MSVVVVVDEICPYGFYLVIPRALVETEKVCIFTALNL